MPTTSRGHRVAYNAMMTTRYAAMAAEEGAAGPDAPAADAPVPPRFDPLHVHVNDGEPLTVALGTDAARALLSLLEDATLSAKEIRAIFAGLGEEAEDMVKTRASLIEALKPAVRPY